MRPHGDHQARDRLRIEAIAEVLALGDGLMAGDVAAVHARAERVRALVDAVVAEVQRRPQTGPTETRS